MKIAVYLLSAIVSLCVLVPNVSAQRPKDDVVVMSTVSVTTKQYSKTYESILYDLDRMFNTTPKMSDPVPIDESERTTLRHTMEDSPIGFFDFGLRGKELKALRGGFELGGMDFYLKSGLAWHPSNNKYVTLTVGKRTTWKYSYRNEHDLFQQVVRRPVEKFNYFLEYPVRTLFGLAIK